MRILKLSDTDKAIYAKMPEMTQKDYQKAAIETWKVHEKHLGAKNFILLCKELDDYVFFTTDVPVECYSNLWNKTLDILQDYRNFKIKGICPDDDYNSIKYWVQDRQTDECFIYFLFDSNQDVVKI